MRILPWLCLAVVFSCPAWAAPAGQSAYGTAEQAVAAFVQALGSKERKDLVKIFGPALKDLVTALEKPQLQYLKRELEAHHSFANKGPEEVELVFGSDRMRFPIRLRMGSDGWYFDTAGAKQSATARVIWNNEISAIQVCRAYVEAQREYFRVGYNADGVSQFARKFRSSAGKRDGLYWEVLPGETWSPLGFLVGRAKSEGYTADARSPRPISYRGYSFKILTGQSAAAREGARSYVLRGHMTEGFALITWPTQWGVSGRRSFMISHDEVIYARDLGKDTARIAAKTSLFNPEVGWRKLRESEER